MVRVDQVLDGLVGHQVLHFRQHRIGPILVQGSLEHRDVVLELNQDAVVRAAAQEPHAVGDLR
jgi:hypothetical protein